MKTCPKCKTAKPKSYFGPSNQTPDGLKYACRKCTNASNREWNLSHPIALKGWKLMKHGLTFERYSYLYDLQGGVCASCGRDPEGKWLEVDHDHGCCPGKFSCGECVRGLLCGRCNRASGNVHDDPDALEALAAYLRKWQEA